MTYQGVWVRGTLRSPGQRDCADRFTAISTYLQRFRRPITVLDLGASEGYFSFRIAEIYDAVCVALEPSARLTELCFENDNARVIHLKHKATVTDLEALGRCEHFDVVLALSMLHWFGGDWKRAADAVFSLGDHVIIETPARSEHRAVNGPIISSLYDYLASQNPSRLASVPSHVMPELQRPLWVFERPKTKLVRSYLDATVEPTTGPVTIQASASEKMVLKHGEEPRAWIPGINLRTFQKLGGAWPLPEKVLEQLETFSLPEERHGDIRPWNFVLNHEGLHLIDGRDGRAVYDDVTSLEQTVDDFATSVSNPPKRKRRRRKQVEEEAGPTEEQ